MKIKKRIKSLNNRIFFTHEFIKAYENAIKYAPTDNTRSVLNERKGDALMGVGKCKEVIQCYELAIDFSFSHKTKRVLLQKIMEVKKYKEAVQDYEEAIV